MPKQNRWRIKQRLGYALKDLTNAQQILVEEGAAFETVHPKYYDAFAASVQLIEQTAGLVKKLDEAI